VTWGPNRMGCVMEQAVSLTRMATQGRCLGVTRTAATTAVLAVTVGSSLVACSGPANVDAASSASVTPSSSSSSPTASASDPTEEAASQAVALVPAYVAKVDDLYLDSSRPLDEVYEVAVSGEATAEASAIGAFRSQGYVRTGRSELVTATATGIDLTVDPNASAPIDLPRVIVTACVDVGGVQAIDARGTSVVPADRPRYLVADLTIVNIDYPDPSSWRVSAAPNRQAQACDG
jgi:hypothetical protein